MHARTTPIVSDPAPSSCQVHVPNGLDRASALSHADVEREAEIKRHGRQMEAAMARYAASSNLADRGDADNHRLRMEALIRGRSEAAKQQSEGGIA